MTGGRVRRRPHVDPLPHPAGLLLLLLLHLYLLLMRQSGTQRLPQALAHAGRPRRTPKWLEVLRVAPGVARAQRGAQLGAQRRDEVGADAARGVAGGVAGGLSRLPLGALRAQAMRAPHLHWAGGLVLELRQRAHCVRHAGQPLVLALGRRLHHGHADARRGRAHQLGPGEAAPGARAQRLHGRHAAQRRRALLLRHPDHARCAKLDVLHVGVGRLLLDGRHQLGVLRDHAVEGRRVARRIAQLLLQLRGHLLDGALRQQRVVLVVVVVVLRVQQVRWGRRQVLHATGVGDGRVRVGSRVSGYPALTRLGMTRLLTGGGYRRGPPGGWRWLRALVRAPAKKGATSTNSITWGTRRNERLTS